MARHPHRTRPLAPREVRHLHVLALPAEGPQSPAVSSSLIPGTPAGLEEKPSLLLDPERGQDHTFLAKGLRCFSAHKGNPGLLLAVKGPCGPVILESQGKPAFLKESVPCSQPFLTSD